MLTTTRMAILLSFFFAVSAQAASVWKVSKGKEFIYVGGTIHLLTEDDYPLPEEYTRAFESSDTVLFETDLAQLSTTAFQQKMLKMMYLKNDKTLADLLKKETVTSLENYLTSRGITLAHVQNIKPAFLLINLTVLELQLAGYAATLGVDHHFSDLAGKQRKQQRWLESPESQLAALDSLSQVDADTLVDYTLKELNQLTKFITNMKKAWRKGDLDTMEKLGLTDLESNYPDVYHALITKRNQNWLPQLEALFLNQNTEFVLVGALHLVGNDSVFSMLREKGYVIEKL